MLTFISVFRGLAGVFYFLSIFSGNGNPYSVVGGSGNDEATIAHYGNIDPAIPFVFSILLMIIGFYIVFSNLSKREGWRGVLLAIVALVFGAISYSLIMPFIVGGAVSL